MQIIETSMIGVRAVKYILKSPRYQMKIVLLPTIHMAEIEFYNEIKKCLKECTYFLYEGVPGYKSSFITLSYSLLKYRKDLGLVYEADYLSFDEFANKSIHADFSEADSNKNWGKLTFFQRCFFTLFAPCYGIYQFCTATKESIGKRLTTNDLKSREEILRFHSNEELESYIFKKREKILLSELSKQLEKNYIGKLGILYGASHMSTIINYLRDYHDFIIDDSRWMTVMKY